MFWPYVWLLLYLFLITWRIKSLREFPRLYLAFLFAPAPGLSQPFIGFMVCICELLLKVSNVVILFWTSGGYNRLGD